MRGEGETKIKDPNVTEPSRRNISLMKMEAAQDSEDGGDGSGIDARWWSEAVEMLSQSG